MIVLRVISQVVLLSLFSFLFSFLVYQRSIVVNRASVILEFTVKELAQVVVMSQVGILHLIEVASKDPAVQFESWDTEPHG